MLETVFIRKLSRQEFDNPESGIVDHFGTCTRLEHCRADSQTFLSHSAKKKEFRVEQNGSRSLRTNVRVVGSGRLYWVVYGG